MSGQPGFEGQHPNRVQFAEFHLAGKVFIVTGGGRGLGLELAEALAEAGGKVYCLDIREKPANEWAAALSRVVPEWSGSLYYIQVDVCDTKALHAHIEKIADENKRLDGVVAAAGIVQNTPALDYSLEDLNRMFAINFTGVFMTAQAAARAMIKYKCHGSICFIASMSGLIANKGILSPAYNSSKAALIQLARNMAMELSPMRKDGSGGIRVNCISPGHTITPLVQGLLDKDPGLMEIWTRENMMGRLATPKEFRGAALFLLSNASSFMTGNNLVIDGGHTAW